MGSTVQPTPRENPAGPRGGAQATDGGDHQGNHQEKPPRCGQTRGHSKERSISICKIISTPWNYFLS